MNFTKQSDGSKIDLTGATLTFTMKKDDTDPDVDAVIQKDLVIQSPATDGQAILTLTPIDTDQDTGDYVYDIQLVDATSSVSTILKESIAIKQDVTITA